MKECNKGIYKTHLGLHIAFMTQEDTLTKIGIIYNHRWKKLTYVNFFSHYTYLKYTDGKTLSFLLSPEPPNLITLLFSYFFWLKINESIDNKLLWHTRLSQTPDLRVCIWCIATRCSAVCHPCPCSSTNLLHFENHESFISTCITASRESTSRLISSLLINDIVL